MKTLPILAALLLASLAFADDGPRKIEMTAKKFEFNPSTLQLVKGQAVELTIKSLDRKHGFKCKELGIEGIIEPDKPLTLTFTPDKAGSFAFECSKWCGMGHGKMKGTIEVKAE